MFEPGGRQYARSATHVKRPLGGSIHLIGRAQEVGERYAQAMGSFAKRAAESQDVPRRSPGETIVLREIWHGRVWTARPVTVVEDVPNRLMSYSPHGNRFRVPARPDGSTLRLYAEDWHLVEDEWRGPSVLSFAFPRIPYAVLLFFGSRSGELEGYYVNLQSPLVRNEVGFDYVEHILDVRIRADRTGWSWKDEDELDEAVERGLFTPHDAERFHRWGERAVERVVRGEPPFDRDWSTWRPDPGWGVPELPEDWDTAPIAVLTTS